MEQFACSYQQFIKQEPQLWRLLIIKTSLLDYNNNLLLFERIDNSLQELLLRFILEHEATAEVGSFIDLARYSSNYSYLVFKVS